MYRILLPIDSDDARVGAQVQTVSDLLAVAEDVEVTLLHVFDDVSRADATSPGQLLTGRNATERLRTAGATVVERSEVGEPAAVILDVAQELGADQIVLGGRKRSPLGTLVFGSVSQDVMRRAKRPVTVTGSAADLERPSHRCRDCGETYYTDPEMAIGTCRRCGGVHVEALERPTAAP